LTLSLFRKVKKFWSALGVQRRVVYAIMLRELMAHYGREGLGFFWIVGSPMILTVGVMIMWGMAGESNRSTLGVIPFALTGYTIITLWRHLVGHATGALQHNMSLMFHRNVHYLDTLIARALLEMLAIGLSFSGLYTCLYVTGNIDPIYDFYLIVAGYLAAGWLSFSVGLIITGLTQMNPVVERFVQPTMYITLPFTGLFFMISWLPAKVADVVVYSPLANCFEMLRDGMFGHKVHAMWDAPYLIECNTVLTAIGLLLVRKARRSVVFE
jgi:capsular polysaccharide transport system permease protein